MTDQSAIRKFLFSKAMPNGDVFYYEEEFLMDMLTGVEQSVMVKLVGVRKKGRGPILALSSSAVNNEFDELAPIGTPQQLPLSSRSSLAIATDRAVSHDLRDQSPAPAPTLDLSAYEPKVRYHVARHGKVLEVDPYYPEVQNAGVPVLHEINIGVRERSDSFASTVDDYGNSQRCFDIAASASSSLVTGSDKRMLVRPLGSQSTLWDDHGLDERRQRAVSYDEYFEQSAETPDWVYRTLSPDEQFRPELVELEPFGAPPLSRRLTLNAQANSVVQPGADAANSEAGTEQTAAAVAAPAETSEAVYEATGTNGYDSELAAFSGYTNYAQYYTQDGHAQGLEQVTRGHSRSERMSGQDSRQRYNAYANPALQGEAAFKDFSTPQDRSRSDFSSPRSKAAAQPEPKSQRSAQSYNGISNEFSSNTMVSSAVNGSYQRQTQAQVLRPQLSHPELYERATITTRKPGRTGPIAGVSAKAENLVGTYNPGYDGSTLSTLTGAARYGNYDYAGDLSNGTPDHYSAPPAPAPQPKASNWREAIVAARSGVSAATLTPDYVAALKGAQAARFTKARRAHSLAHLDLPAVNTYMPEDPHYMPTDSAIAFADQHAAYHQAYSHGHSVSRYAYGADFDDDEGKARKEQLARLRAQRQAERLSERAAHSHEGFTSARDLYDAEGNTWWRDQGLTEQSAQAAFSEENFHQGKHGSFIGTPEEFIPEDKTQQVSTVNAQLVTTSAATIVTAPAPDATVITGDKALGNKSGQLYQSEPESAPNDHTRIVYNKPQETAGLNDDEQAEAYEALRAQESFNDLGAVHHHPNAWDSAAQTQTAYFEDFVPGNAPSGDFADFITADERRKRAQQQPKENVLNARSSYDHSEQDPTHRKPKRLINPQLPQDAVDVAAQAATSSQAQGFKPAPAVAAEVPERLSATPVYDDEPSVPEVAPAPNHDAHATYVAHTANHAYAAAAAQQARNTVQAAPEAKVTPEVYGAYGHKAQYGDFDAYGHDEQISSSMVKGYAKQVSAHTAISAGAGTGPYEPAHQGHDFSDFSTADGSKIEGEIKVPVTSQKQAESERLAQQSAAVLAEPKAEAEAKPETPVEPKVKAESHGAASDETSATAKPVEAPVAEPAPEPKAKPTVSAAVQALAANLVATAAQEIDAEEQAAAEAKAAAAAATSESDADKLGMSKSQLKRAKRRAKARSRGNSGSQAAVSAEVKAAPASTTQAESAPAASSAVPVAEAKPAPAAAPAAANAVEKVAQAQADAAYLDGIVMNPAASAAPSVNPELMAQAEQYLKGNAQNTESLDIGTARDEAPVLAPSELEGHSALQGLFAGVTPEDDDDVALDGLPNPDAFGAGLDQSFKPDSTPPVPESAFDLGESELKVEPVTTPMPLTAKSQEAAPATQPQAKAQSNYSVNPITGALSSQPRSLMNGGFNEHTVVVKAEYSLDSLDELHKLFSNSTPTAMPQTGINDSGADTNGFSNNAYQPINTASQPKQEAKSAEPAHRAQEEQERLERVLKEAEAAEHARREQEERERQEAEAKARAEAEEQARREQEERERQEAEAKARAEAEAAERARREQEERERQEAEAKARAEAEAAERAHREQEERERQEAEAKARAEAEERARREQEERERQEAEAKARAEERARREQEERERQEAEAKARAEAEAAERARREQEERERQEAEAKARAEAEAAERARREQEERERQEAEAKARAEAEAAERARREQEERERQEAEAKARAEAEAAERARREQEERERQEAEAKARAEAEAAERARREQEERERQEAEAKARAEAEAVERARREQEERERQEAEAKARAEAEAAERARREQEERKRQEAEAKARAEAAMKQEPSASSANKAASGTDVPENLLFAAPKRFVSGDGAEQAATPNPERNTSGAAAAAVQAAVAGVLSSSLQPAEHSDDLMKATEEDFLGNSFSETEQNPKLEKASSTSSSLASLAAELIDDFDDPFGDDFAQSIDEDGPRK